MHQIGYPHQAATLIALLDLPIDQPSSDLPLALRRPTPTTHWLLRRQGVEILIQAVTREHREAEGGQPRMQLVDHRVSGLLAPCAGYPLGDAAPG
jgi:hypothetical protein